MFSVLWNKLKRDEQGFTLVELLIVIIILGVLATIGIPTYRGFVDRAHEAATLAELQAVSMAIKYYFIEKGEKAPFEDVQPLKRYLGDDLTDSGEYLGTYTLTFKKATGEKDADHIIAQPKVEDRLFAKIYVQPNTNADIKRGEIEIFEKAADAIFDQPYQ